MKRIPLLLVFLISTVSTVSTASTASTARPVRSRDDQATSILERFAAVRPGPGDLGVYRLDWAASLEEARNRATGEKRPVLLVIIHAKYGDLNSGHC